MAREETSSIVCSASAIEVFPFTHASFKLAAHSYRHRPLFKQRVSKMDLSKLPKMSQTPPPPPAEPPQQPNPQPVDGDQISHVEAGVGGMVWVSVILGS